MDVEKEFNELIKNILVELRNQLEDIQVFPHDFNSYNLHDTIQREIDAFVSGFSRQECLAFIDYCGTEDMVDEGIIDKSSIDRLLITMAFECINQELFEKEPLLYELQEYELTQRKAKKFIDQINERVGSKKKSKGNDNETQVFITMDFELSLKDFPKPYFAEGQVIDLQDGLKIFTNNKEVNRNAIVLEGINKPNKEVRIYLMDKDADIDIRDFFKYTPSIEENDYRLDAKTYVNGKLKKHFENKKELIYYLNQMTTWLNYNKGL